MPTVKELRDILKSKGFCCFQKLVKHELESLLEQFEKTGKVPLRYRSFSMEELTQIATVGPKKIVTVLKPAPKVQKEACTLYKDITLQTHQQQIVKFMKQTQRKGLILFHSVGSGKTITAITIARCLFDNPDIQRVIILTPKSVVPQWESQFETLQLQSLRAKFEIHSHEKWLNMFSEKKVHARNSVLIIDEAHKFRSKIIRKKDAPNSGHLSDTHIKSGKYSKRMIEAAAQAKKIIFLTATPLVNNEEDVRNMLVMLDGESNFAEGYKKYKELENLANFGDAVKCKFSYYFNKQSKDFPNANIFVTQLHMNEDYLKKYMLIEKNLIEDLKKEGVQVSFKNVKSLKAFLNGIRRAVNNIDKNTDSPKVQWLLQHVKQQVEAGNRSIIYSSWKSHGVDLMKEKLSKAGISFAEVSGATAMSSRHHIVQRYNRGELPVLMITAAGSEGLDLKQTKNVYIMEPHWNQTRIEQTIGRAVRYKSHADLPDEDKVVDVYYILLSKPPGAAGMKSADEVILEISSKKQELIDDVYVQKIVETSIEHQKKC